MKMKLTQRQAAYNIELTCKDIIKTLDNKNNTADFLKRYMRKKIDALKEATKEFN
jgi:hypothetical protein